MDSVARLHVAWELKQAGKKADYIAERGGVSRATVYRWWAGIRQLDVWLDYYHYIRPSMAFEPMPPPLSRASHLI